MRRIMIFAIMAATLAGLTGCDWEWLGCKPKPDPSPSPIPGPSPSPAPFGTIVKTLPASVAGTYGSIDFKGDTLVEYCHGGTRLYFRDITTGDLKKTLDFDSRLSHAWAVAWDETRGCYWLTNPECQGIAQNLIQLGENGEYVNGYKMMGGDDHDNWIRNYDCDVNEDYTYPPAGPDSSGYQIKPGQVFVGSIHYSLQKWEFDDVTNPAKYTEAWWFKEADFTIHAVTRTGSTYWAAEWGGYKIHEYKQASRRAFAEKTGRVISVPFIASSLKYHDGLLWARGKSGTSANIYAISLGE